MEIRLGIELGEGECEAIALAMKKQIFIFLTNDEAANHVGKILSREPKGVLYVLLRSVREGYLTKKKAKESLRQILKKVFGSHPLLSITFIRHQTSYKKHPLKTQLKNGHTSVMNRYLIKNGPIFEKTRLSGGYCPPSLGCQKWHYCFLF